MAVVRVSVVDDLAQTRLGELTWVCDHHNIVAYATSRNFVKRGNHISKLPTSDTSRSENGRLHRWSVSLGSIENDRNLLQGVSSSLGIEEVCDHAVEDDHHDEDDVILPSNSCEGDWVDECVEDDPHSHRDPHCGEAFGA